MNFLLKGQITLEPFHMALLFIIPVILLLASLSRARKRAPYPPGPKGMPVIGNLLMMGQLTHQGLANLAKEYGGIFHLRMGFLHMVAISNPETARQVLQVQDNIFSNRPATIAISYLTYDRADMSFAHYGPMWRQMRKLCVLKLFSRNRAESWQAVRDQIHSFGRAVGSSAGEPVNIREMVFDLTKNIVYRAAFGSSWQEGEDDFTVILQEFSKLFGAFNIADFIPCLGWIDLQGFNSRLTKARRAMDSFIDRIIDQHVKKKSISGVGGEEDTDMVDEVLALSRNEANVLGSDDMHNSIKFTKDNIKGLIMDVMFGGTETVALAIEWVMAEMMRNPQDLKRVQQELNDVVGQHRHVDESDVEGLTHLRCAIKETLRLHPPIPLLLHETAEDAVVAGYFVPKKTRVLINTWAIGRDGEFWEDQHTFKPSRFLNQGAPDFRGGNFEFIPFGSGRRSCPGMQLGLHTLELAVAHLLHCFTWELPGGMKPSEMDMRDVFGLTAPRASPLVVVPTRRVACPL